MNNNKSNNLLFSIKSSKPNFVYDGIYTYKPIPFASNACLYISWGFASLCIQIEEIDEPLYFVIIDSIWRRQKHLS